MVLVNAIGVWVVELSMNPDETSLVFFEFGGFTFIQEEPCCCCFLDYLEKRSGVTRSWTNVYRFFVWVTTWDFDTYRICVKFI